VIKQHLSGTTLEKEGVVRELWGSVLKKVGNSTNIPVLIIAVLDNEGVPVRLNEVPIFVPRVLNLEI